MNCRAKNWDFKTNIWCVDEIVVYCACAEWCPPLLAGWLQYIIPGVWRSVWWTAHVLNGVPHYCTSGLVILYLVWGGVCCVLRMR